MSDEDLEAGVESPVIEAVEAPVDSAPVDAVSDEAPAASDPSLSDDTAPDDDAPVSFPSHDDFGWDDWDGAADKLPESVRGWADRVTSYHSTRHQSELQAQQQRLKQQHNLYETLISGREDPRVAELTAKHTEWETKHADLTAKYSALEDEKRIYEQGVQQSIELEAERYAKAFQESNTDIFNDDDLSNLFADLLEEGWDLDTAAEASRLPQSALKVARGAKVDGVPDSYALKLARGTKMRTPQPRPGAKITSGATTPSRSAERVETTDTGAMSLKDWRNHVARNAMKKTNRRA